MQTRFPPHCRSTHEEIPDFFFSPFGGRGSAAREDEDNTTEEFAIVNEKEKHLKKEKILFCVSCVM